jgi:hypothetical protein
MSLFPDPITDLIGLFLKRAIDSRISKRAELLLEMSIAGGIAFLAACGIALLAQHAVAWAVGCGMAAAAVALFATFQASPNAKGLVISLPQQVAEKKLDTPMTTIERK